MGTGLGVVFTPGPGGDGSKVCAANGCLVSSVNGAGVGRLVGHVVG